MKPGSVDDAWAWVNETRAEPRPELGGVAVGALVIAPAAGMEALVAAIAGQTVAPTEIVVSAASDGDAAALAAGRVPVRTSAATEVDGLRAAVTIEASHYWVFVTDGDLDVPPGTLEALLLVAEGDPGADLTAPLVLRRASRRADAYVEWAGVTLTPGGLPVSPEAAGEVDQGQVGTPEVLGVPPVGMLARVDAVTRAGGFGSGPLVGLELGMAVTAAGGRVTVAGRAPVTCVGPPPEAAATELRRAGLNLAGAISRVPLWNVVTTVLGSMVAILGAVLARDWRQASDTARALRGWMSDSDLRGDLRTRFAQAAQTPGGARVKRLRMSRREVARHSFTAVSGRVGDWVDGFTARIDSGSVIDELTSDETPLGQARWRLSPAVAGFVILLGLAGVGGIRLFAPGLVTGELLLPAPGFGELWASFLDPVAGQPGGSGPPWLAVVGLASVLTFGSVDLVVAASFLLTVPLAWLATYRLLRQLLSEQVLAVLAALAIALAPVLVGGLNRGSLAAAWVVLVGVLGVLASMRLVREPSWRWVAACGLTLTLLIAATPLLWGPAAAVAAWGVVTRRLSWRHAVTAVVMPLVWLAPWAPTLWRWPGRLLTGPEPLLASTASPEGWWLLLGRDSGSGLPPLWLGAVVVGVLWVLAMAGLVRGGSRTWPGWVLAGVGLGGAVGLGKVLVSVGPGGPARPDLSVWLALFVAGLALAAVLGCDGVLAELRGSSVGWRQVIAGLLALAAVGAAVLGIGWWVTGGTKGLQRDELSAIPPFVRNALTSETPGRALALSVDGDVARWALLEDDLPRLGDAERGIAAGGSAAAQLAAGGVVTRLLTGTADDSLVADMRSLGVTHIWVAGANQQVLTGIGNTPGLGAGSGDNAGWVWQVPDSGRLTVVGGARPIPTGDGVEVSGGAAGRELVLAEPADPRWRASVGGVALEPLAATDWRQRFSMPAQAGRLSVHLDAGPPWWAWFQLAGLVWVLVMIAPASRGSAPIGQRGAA